MYNESTFQVEKRFRSGRNELGRYSRNRVMFKAFNNECLIEILNKGADDAEIYSNGKRIPLGNKLSEGKIVTDLKGYLREGENTLKVQNIESEDSSLTISIPYPTLIKDAATHRSFCQEKLSMVDDLINSEINEGFPGAVLRVIKDGAIIKESAYGYQRKFEDDGTRMSRFQKMTPYSIFDLASNTKMYATNFAIMKLVSEGKLDLNRPIKDYLGSYSGGQKDEITCKDLLTHSAGYEPEVNFFKPDNETGLEFYSQNRNKTIELLKKKMPFSYAKGTKTVYSDTDYMLLGLVIESITGMRQDQYVENDIFKPLGLQNTMYCPLEKGRIKCEFAATEIHGTTRGWRREYPNIRNNVLQGEVHDEKTFYSMDQVAGHAGLFSTAILKLNEKA